jgi:hypothetical protein
MHQISTATNPILTPSTLRPLPYAHTSGCLSTAHPQPYACMNRRRSLVCDPAARTLWAARGGDGAWGPFPRCLWVGSQGGGSLYARMAWIQLIGAPRQADPAGEEMGAKPMVTLQHVSAVAWNTVAPIEGRWLGEVHAIVPLFLLVFFGFFCLFWWAFLMQPLNIDLNFFFNWTWYNFFVLQFVFVLFPLSAPLYRFRFSLFFGCPAQLWFPRLFLDSLDPFSVQVLSGRFQCVHSLYNSVALNCFIWLQIKTLKDAYLSKLTELYQINCFLKFWR